MFAIRQYCALKLRLHREYQYIFNLQLTWYEGCVFPHPEPIFFRETAFFSFSKKNPLFQPIRGKKASFLGGDKNYHTRVVHVRYEAQGTIRSGLWAVFSVVFTRQFTW